MPTQDGGIANTFIQLSHLDNSHFQHVYKEPAAANLAEIIRLTGNFPSFVDFSSEELEGTLKWFKKDKSPKLDGWTIQFYLDFMSL